MEASLLRPKHRLAQRGRRDQLVGQLGEEREVLLGKHDAAAIHRLGYGCRSEGHHRDFGSHRLDQGHSKSLVLTHRNKDRSSPIGGDQSGMRHFAEKLDIPQLANASPQLPEVRISRLVLSGDHQLGVRLQPQQLCLHRKQIFEAFVGKDSAHGKNDRLLLPQSPQCRLIRLVRGKSFRIDKQGHHVNVLVAIRPKLLRVELGDCNCDVQVVRHRPQLCAARNQSLAEWGVRVESSGRDVVVHHCPSTAEVEDRSAQGRGDPVVVEHPVLGCRPQKGNRLYQTRKRRLDIQRVDFAGMPQSPQQATEVERGEAGRIAGDEIGNDLMNHRCHGSITVGMSSHTTAVHQLVSVLRLDDAVGNIVLELQRRLRSWGYESTIFARTDEQSRSTPAHFFERFDNQMAASSTAGRNELLELVPVCERAYGLSRFSAEELGAAGFANISVLPLPLVPPALKMEPDATWLSRFNDGCFNVLFVGRAAPNKRIEDVLSVFAAFQRLYQPNSRLLIAGEFPLESAYVRWLNAIRARLRIQRIHFLGRLPTSQLSACYQVSHVYLSMSQHEGLGLPLLEAMHRQIPVVAYGAAAVPETMGGAGLVTMTQDPLEVARLLAVLDRNPVLRKRVVDRQNLRVAAILPDPEASALRRALEPLFNTPELQTRGPQLAGDVRPGDSRQGGHRRAS